VPPVRRRRKDAREVDDRRGLMFGDQRRDRFGVEQVDICGHQRSGLRAGPEPLGSHGILVGAQVHRDDGAATPEQDLGTPAADLSERAGDQNRTHCGAAHLVIRRASTAVAFLMRSEMKIETNTLKMSSRSLVSVDVLMSHCPSTFS
jgi:hypothetical protein